MRSELVQQPDMLASCTEQFNGATTGFDLVRTQSGATFASWVVYTAQSSFAVEEQCQDGELPMCYRYLTATSTTGTADLVVARLTESEATLSRFRFELGGILTSPGHAVAMVARGDTLLVAATLSGDTTLTYLEIDARQLQ